MSLPNPAFERDAAKSAAPLNFTLEPMSVHDPATVAALVMYRSHCKSNILKPNISTCTKMNNFNNSAPFKSFLQKSIRVKSLVYRYQIHDVFGHAKGMPHPFEINRIRRVAQYPIHLVAPVEKISTFLQFAILRAWHMAKENTVATARVKHLAGWLEVLHHCKRHMLRSKHNVLVGVAELPGWLKLQARLHMCSNSSFQGTRYKRLRRFPLAHEFGR